MKKIATVLGALLLAVGAVGAVFIVGMRRKSPPVLRAVRRMNRSFWNPKQMQTAGTPGAYAGIIRHTGRTSGRAYETPVGVVATDDGFVIALPYGSHADWLQNVLASGTATVVVDGATHEVHQPEMVAVADMAHVFSPAELRSFRLFAVDQCLRLRRAATPDPVAGAG